MLKSLKELIRATIVGTSIFVVFFCIYYIRGDYDNGLDFSLLLKNYAINLLYSIIIYMADAFLIRHLLQRFDKNLFSGRRFFISLGSLVVVSLMALFVARFVHEVIIEKTDVQAFLAAQSLQYYGVSMLVAIVVAMIFFAFFYYKYRQEFKVKEQKIIAGAASAKFDALKNQLDPHFLFNSLNVLTSLIEEDPYQAQKFTTLLSKVYRYVLEQKGKELVSIDEELKFAKTYVRLLKMRFEDSIVFDIPDKSVVHEGKIVPLSLQLLLENAVKHNVVTSERPLHIKVFEEGNVLVVVNNLQEKQVVKKSSGVGLRNIRQRYGLLTDRTLDIERSEVEFRVCLPILSKLISKMETQEEYIADKRYEKAKQRVENIKGFYGNVLAYCIVIPFLVILNYKTTSFPWVLFPIFGWGFGVLIHGMEAFGFNPILGKGWEEKKMREYMDDENF
ncbi:2TM domain-containing protein [Pareuzebyella sediminis]|uniref:2TM domain-containing protein n=1 Tax=Pareuzebyella sediminis TaxID=2607998 RepID=UPI0011EE12F8|nr:2TM domain-containing protein [Pareuzebyella sediminis]